MEVSIREANSFLDFLFIRKLRNQVRHLMTGDQRRLSLRQQYQFYRGGKWKGQLFVAEHGRERVGYLYLRRHGETHLITEAVAERYRGRGLGRTLVAFAIETVDDITAEIYADNEPSIRLHERLGFVKVAETARLSTYRFQRREASAPAS